MIRGAQKKVVVIKTADSKIFEEAYFVLKKDRGADGGDMVKEANRIIESFEESDKKEKGEMFFGRLYSTALVIFGGGVGALSISLIYALVA